MNIWDQRSFDWPDLPAAALIVEVGGFEGRWAAEMAERYECDLHVFEPAFWAMERILARMHSVSRQHRVTVYPYALGIESGTFPMGGFHTDSSSFLKGDEFFAAHPEEGRTERGMGEMRDVVEVFATTLAGRTVDLMMVNIEGYEFRLLPYMHAQGLLERVERIAVQFHGALDRGGEERLVRWLLDKTHDVLWDYPALTAWRRR